MSEPRDHQNRPYLVRQGLSPAVLVELRTVREVVLSHSRGSAEERREFVAAMRILLDYMDIDAQLEATRD